MKTTLKDLRMENKKSRSEVAAALGVTVSALEHYENGRREIGLRQVLVLSELYGCSAEEVINAQLNSCQNVRANNLMLPQNNRRVLKEC